MSERRDKKQVMIPTKPRADEWVAQGREKPVATEQKMKRLTLDLPEDLHRAIKRRAVEEGVMMVEMLRTLLEGSMVLGSHHTAQQGNRIER